MEESILVFDVETTGIPDNHQDNSQMQHEILQLAMIDGSGEILFNKLFKPARMIDWLNAELIHGISPRDVQSKSNIGEYREVIQGFVNKAALLVAYNSYDR